MSDPTSLLFGLDDYVVLEVTETPGSEDVRVLVEPRSPEGGCPDCGVVSTRVKQRPVRRLKDLPASGQRVELWLRGRRLQCLEAQCSRGTFTQTTTAVPARARCTQRLRDTMARSIARSNRSVADVAREHAVSWATAHQALVAAAVAWLPPPQPTRVLGIDETRARSVRWYLAEHGWARTNPWLTSFVDADPTRSGRLLGLAPGRSGTCVKDWLGEQTKDFRAGIEVVVIDPSAPYASGIRAALPQARIAVDHWHLVKLGNDAVTGVRQRLSQDVHGRRGRSGDLAWAHRQMLLTASQRLSTNQLARLVTVLTDGDPSGQLQAAWDCKERLRELLASPSDRRIMRARLTAFFEACAAADLPETTRLATTIQTWWPAILVFLTEQVSNARTEGFNRIIKNVKRTGCGYRNMDNYERRILTHIALTRAA